jgi:hypothetical protein
MFMLLNNILPCRTCLKPRRKIIKRCAKNIFLLQHVGHQPWWNFELTFDWTKTLLLGVHVADPYGSDNVWIFADVVEYIFVKVYCDMSSKSIKEYSN